MYGSDENLLTESEAADSSEAWESVGVGPGRFLSRANRARGFSTGGGGGGGGGGGLVGWVGGGHFRGLLLSCEEVEEGD